MTKCPSCLRVNQRGTPNCIHCGAMIKSQSWLGNCRPSAIMGHI